MQTAAHRRSPWPNTLLGVWAHPDDEAYLSAGLMGRVRDAGGRVVCLHATLGEQGTGDPERWPPDRLAATRRHELTASLAAVGVSESILLGYRDGELRDVDPEPAVARIIDVIESVQPDLIVTFGPDGMTGHADHLTVCRWTTAAWRRAAPTCELFYATTTEAFADRHGAMYEELSLVDRPDLPVRTPTADIALDVDLSGWELDRKRVALAAHASQTTELAGLMGEERYRRWFDHETFRRPTYDEVRAALEHMPLAA